MMPGEKKGKGVLRMTVDGLVEATDVKCAVCSESFDVEGSLVEKLSSLVPILVAPALCDACHKCPKCGKPADFSVLMRQDEDGLTGKQISVGCVECGRFYGGSVESWFAYVDGLMAMRAKDEHREALNNRPCVGVEPKPSCFGCYAKPACDILASVEGPADPAKPNAGKNDQSN